MPVLTKQIALLIETADMALGTLRGNKMRSALTILGVVIGVTSIVGMTSLIRGFDTSLRDSISALGPRTIVRPVPSRSRYRGTTRLRLRPDLGGPGGSAAGLPGDSCRCFCRSRAASSGVRRPACVYKSLLTLFRLLTIAPQAAGK